MVPQTGGCTAGQVPKYWAKPQPLSLPTAFRLTLNFIGAAPPFNGLLPGYPETTFSQATEIVKDLRLRVRKSSAPKVGNLNVLFAVQSGPTKKMMLQANVFKRSF